MTQLPMPLRAAVGLLAKAADEARHFPDRAVELPMLAVSTVLQASLRVQQRYTMLAARGDEVLNRRPTTDEPPSWASFDDSPVSAVPDAAAMRAATETDDAATAPLSPSAAGVEDPDDPELPTAERPAPNKKVRRPRNGAPSKFDTVDDS